MCPKWIDGGSPLFRGRVGTDWLFDLHKPHPFLDYLGYTAPRGTDMIAKVAKWVTLTPSDILATERLGATEPIKPGDVMDAEIEGIVMLRNLLKLGN